MKDGNVVALDETVENNHRLVRKEWIEQKHLAGLQNSTGTSQFFVGIPADNADFTSLTAGNGNVAAEDFALAVGIAQPEAIRGSSWKLKLYKDGAQVHDIGIGGTGTNTIHDVVFSNVDGRWVKLPSRTTTEPLFLLTLVLPSVRSTVEPGARLLFILVSLLAIRPSTLVLRTQLLACL